ncbi:MAG TPA: molybdopterin-synthase adenylyltransferase MoeB [Nevskiales bacterium]|nr:molybdopterin-synthase adenylyltransferase MoeB [Nevskiales bacterium]
MSDLRRYARQMILPQVDTHGQQALRDSHALVIGVGGLGSAAALYLAAAGVGRLTLVDRDRVELSNLQRQIAHRHGDIGRPKAESARDSLLALNPEVAVTSVNSGLDAALLARLVSEADVVLDCSDNFPTRYALNRACVAARKPLVSGAAIRLEGQVAVFRPGGPCYQCLYRDEPGEATESCEQAGVLGPLVGVIGSLQALEAVKLLLGLGETLDGRLLLFDAARSRFRELKLKRDPACPGCSETP